MDTTPEAPTFAVGNRVRYDFADGYLVTKIRRVSIPDPRIGRPVYDVALPETRDDELLLWAEELRLTDDSPSAPTPAPTPALVDYGGYDFGPPEPTPATRLADEARHAAAWIKSMPPRAGRLLGHAADALDAAAAEHAELVKLRRLYEEATTSNAKLRAALEGVVRILESPDAPEVTRNHAATYHAKKVIEE